MMYCSGLKDYSSQQWKFWSTWRMQNSFIIANTCVCVFKKNKKVWEATFLSAVNILSSVESFGSDHQLFLDSVLVTVSESYNSQWSASTRIVDDLLDHSLDVSMSFGEVHGSQFGSAFAVKCVWFEGMTWALSLCTDHPTHFFKFFTSK